MNNFIDDYDETIKQLKNIPNIGQKGSERIFDKLLVNKTNIDLLINTLNEIKLNYSQCFKCFSLMIKNNCIICDDQNRNLDQLCVISTVHDSILLAKSKLYKGQMHVLNGEIAIKKNITPDKLTITQLIKRILVQDIKEIIFALNSTFEGEVTLMYIKKIINDKCPDVLISRISQGLPLGGTLEYIDEFTLKRALEDRKTI